jgi:hypothetical protein
MEIGVNDTPKGQQGEWKIYKHEGVPGLAMPDHSYWFAINGDRRIAHDTKAGLLRTIEIVEGETEESRAHFARVAAMLLAN